MDDGIKRDIRVAVQSNGKIKWQIKRSDMEQWDYDPDLPIEDWDALLERAEARYCRRRMPLEDLEIIRKARKDAAAD